MLRRRRETYSLGSDVVERIGKLNRMLDLAVGIGDLIRCSICRNKALRLMIEQIRQEIKYELGDLEPEKID